MSLVLFSVPISLFMVWRQVAFYSAQICKPIVLLPLRMEEPGTWAPLHNRLLLIWIIPPIFHSSPFFLSASTLSTYWRPPFGIPPPTHPRLPFPLLPLPLSYLSFLPPNVSLGHLKTFLFSGGWVPPQGLR